MLKQSLLLISLPCLGLLAGYYLANHAAPQADLAPASPEVAREDEVRTEAALARLQQRLAVAEQERTRLADRVAMLEAQIGDPAALPASDPATAAGATRQQTDPATTARRIRTSVETLIETGIPEQQAAWIQARLDEYDLERLYLQDRARREGWLNSARYRDEQRQIQNAYQELRPEIGEDAYDRMLYALGRANRVVVRDVMQNSTADLYGLQANDRIIEYNGQRVYTTQELSTRVSAVEAGAPVTVRVLRDGEVLDFYLPRGPLGVRLTTSRERP
jgi:hypothetical protein